MTEGDMRALLRHASLQAGGWDELAIAWGTSSQYLYLVSQGHKNVTNAVARQLGYRLVKARQYEPLEEVSPNEP